MAASTVGHQCVRCLHVTPDRPDKCSVCGFPEQTLSFVMVYEARSPRAARKAYERDLARLRQQGYEPMPGRPTWVEGDDKGKVRTALRWGITEAFDVLFPPKGYLRVELRRWDLTPEQALARPDDAIKWGA